MGKNNKSGQEFSPHHQGKRDSESGAVQKEIYSTWFSTRKQQGKSENVTNKDKNFNEKFQQKQHDKTASNNEYFYFY
jgi:hypothetical protein